MAKTPLSGDNSYCEASAFCDRYDWRTLAQYLSDTDTPLASRNDVEDSTILEILLKEASGMVEAAAMLGERYSPDDLSSLTGNSKELLCRIVSDLTIGKVIQRRPDLTSPPFKGVQDAMEFLGALSRGELIFGFEETSDAGHMDHEIEDIDDVIAQRLPSWRARRLFWRRNRWYGPYTDYTDRDC